MGNRLTVVMYHYVRDLKNSRYPEIKGCDVRLFREQVQYIKKHYTPVTVEQVLESQNSGEKLPEHAILLTFDDAYADHFTYAFPILYHEHIQGVFFPPVKAVTEHTVLDVNKVHFILATTPSEKMPMLLSELRRMVDANRDEYGLDTFENYFEKLAVASRFDPKEVIFVKRLLRLRLEVEYCFLQGVILRKMFIFRCIDDIFVFVKQKQFITLCVSILYLLN